MARAPLTAQAPRRSEYLAQALDAIAQQGQNIQSPITLGTNLLATYLLDRNLDRERERERIAAEEADKPRREALSQLLGAFGGGGQGAVPGQPTPVALTDEQGMPAPIPGSPTSASAPSLSDPDFQRALVAAQMAGVDGVGGIVDVLQAGQPDLRVAPDGTVYDARNRSLEGQNLSASEYINNFRVNPNDPDAPDYLPELPEGGRPLYDEAGNPVGVQPLAGYLEMQGGVEAARAGGRMAGELPYVGPTAAAQAAGQGMGSAPYDLVEVEGRNGQRLWMSRSEALAGGAAGQTTAEGEAAAVAGRTEAEREAEIFRRAEAAPSAIRRYQGALDLLPDAITGFGAEARLQGARVLAGAGNQDAQRAVEATQLYQTLINRDLGILIREIAGSTQISNTDREFAARVSGGDIEMDPGTLRRLLEIYVGDQQRYIDQADALRSRGSQTGAQAPRIRRWNPQTQDFD